MDPDFWISLTICIGLAGAALWLVHVHWQHWQEVDADPNLQPRERDHLRRRHRRRMQTSTMLGFVGVAILAGRLFPPDDAGIIAVVYWFCVGLLVLWMALLAVVDMFATRMHYGSLRQKVDIERTRLEAQLRRAESEQRSSSPTSENKRGEKTGSSEPTRKDETS